MVSVRVVQQMTVESVCIVLINRRIVDQEKKQCCIRKKCEGLDSSSSRIARCQVKLPMVHLSGRAVATPYLGMVLVFMGFGRFQASETAIKQAQNLKLMEQMQSTGQTDTTQPIRYLQMRPRAQGSISEKPHIFLSFFFLSFLCHQYLVK